MPHPLRARLGKLAPALSAKERFVLFLRAHNAGEPEDPDLRRTMPRGQVRAFNRFAHLAYVANATLGPVLFALSVHAEGIEYTHQRLGILDRAAGQLEANYPKELEEDQQPGTVTVPEFLRGLAKELRSDTQRELSLRWRELRALDTVWAEITEEFDGEPVTDASVRKLADETRAKLQEVARALAPAGQTPRFPAPTAEFVDQLRAVVGQAYERMGWIEPEETNPSGRSRHGRPAR